MRSFHWHVVGIFRMSHPSYIGIYWTRPVPRAGFVTLSPDVDIAAMQSRTIRYQRDLARRHVRDERGRMISEIVMLELAPDRATRESAASLQRVVTSSSADTMFLIVDFSREVNWRPHRFLWAALPARRTQALLPDPIVIDGMIFDPIQHFREWQSDDHMHRATKGNHRALIETALVDLSDMSWAHKAAHLNDLNLPTHNGREWTADNLRKFMAKK